MNVHSKKIPMLFVFIFVFAISVNAQNQTVKPYAESAECEARAAALTAVPPKLEHPIHERRYYEGEIQTFEPIARGTQFDEETFNALLMANSENREKRIPKLDRRIDELKQDLDDAKNQYASKSLIAELEAKLKAAQDERIALNTPSDALTRMGAAKTVLEANRALTLLVLWEDYDRILKRYSEADEVMEKELDSVNAEYEAEKARFTREFQALKQQTDRSGATLQKGTDLRLRSADVFTQLKNRLQRYICWPEVQTVDKQLEDVIAKLRTSKTSVPFVSDFEIEEIPDDENPFGNDDENQKGTGQGDNLHWTGTWVNDNGIETVTISGGGGSISASFNYRGSGFSGSGQWSGCNASGATMVCSWKAQHDDDTKSGQRSGKLTVTLSGNSISGTLVEDAPQWNYKPGYSAGNVQSSMVAGKNWALTYKRQ